MFSRNLSVPDFVRRFFVSCAQISEALALCSPLKFGCDWRKIGHKSRCRKNSERTFAAFLVGFQVSYSCFWRVSSSKFLLQACLHQIYNLFAFSIISISYSGVFFDCEKKSDSGFMQKKAELLLYSSAKDCFFTLLWQSPVPFQKQR